MTINPDDTLHAITTAWPETVPVFVAQGLPQMGDEAKRAAFGKQVTLRQALAVKRLDLEAFLAHLEEAIRGADGSVRKGAEPGGGAGELRVVGLLPCPVRIPILEALEPFLAQIERERGLKVVHELQAASMGASWIEENLAGLESAEALPDLFISAGFETFFDPRGIGRFRDSAFYDGLPYKRFNSSFDGVGLEDPDRNFSVISVVPAVFMVNRKELGDAPMPRTWEDLLDERFEQRVSLPVGDFDLFSSILLDIHKRYGEEAVRRLGRCLSSSMHPAQMVKLARRPAAPIVTIMPYFFTKMSKAGGPMEPVWPQDGAVISPIFLLAKKARREQVQPLVEFFASAELGKILAHKGLFPSTNPEVDNRLDPGCEFSWLGWEYINSRDISALIRRCQALFEEGREA